MLRRILGRLQRTYRGFRKHDGDLLAASVAYYTALSLFPLLLVLVSGIGCFMRYSDLGQNAEQQVLSSISEYTSASLRDDVRQMLDQVQRNAVAGGSLGILTLLGTAMALFVQFERAFGRIWDAQIPETRGLAAVVIDVLFYRSKAFLMLLGLGALIMVTFAAGMILSAVRVYAEGYVHVGERIWWSVQVAIGVLLNCCAFTLIYRVLPRVAVRWSDALQGGVLAAVVWEAGRVVLAALLIGNKYVAYGLIGSFIALMLWIYYASTVLFLAAEYVRVVADERQLPSRGAADRRPPRD
jgi:membrane protein